MLITKLWNPFYNQHEHAFKLSQLSVKEVKLYTIFVSIIANSLGIFLFLEGCEMPNYMPLTKLSVDEINDKQHFEAACKRHCARIIVCHFKIVSEKLQIPHYPSIVCSLLLLGVDNQEQLEQQP